MFQPGDKSDCMYLHVACCVEAYVRCSTAGEFPAVVTASEPSHPTSASPGVLQHTLKHFHTV